VKGLGLTRQSSVATRWPHVNESGSLYAAAPRGCRAGCGDKVWRVVRVVLAVGF